MGGGSPPMGAEPSAVSRLRPPRSQCAPGSRWNRASIFGPAESKPRAPASESPAQLPLLTALGTVRVALSPDLYSVLYVAAEAV